MKALLPVKAQAMDEDELGAWFDGRIPRRLLAIPFGGPIKTNRNAKGMDIDGQWFSERTDIRPDWLAFRAVDWHHGKDPYMGRTVLGKADNLVMDEDGWWVDQWFTHGERRVELVRKLQERATKSSDSGVQLWGSSESIVGMTHVADSGEITLWPYWRQTLSTSPQNTFSVLRPVKAVLEDALHDEATQPAFWTDIAAQLHELSAELKGPVPGDLEAKAGRVLSATNESDIRAALATLEEAFTRVRAVLDRQPDYSPKEILT